MNGGWLYGFRLILCDRGLSPAAWPVLELALEDGTSARQLGAVDGLYADDPDVPAWLGDGDASAVRIGTFDRGCSIDWAVFGTGSDGNPVEVVMPLRGHSYRVDVSPATHGHPSTADIDRPDLEGLRLGLSYVGEAPEWGRYATDGGWVYGFHLRLCVEPGYADTLHNLDYLELHLENGSVGTLRSGRVTDPRLLRTPFDANDEAPEWLRDTTEWIGVARTTAGTCRQGWAVFTSASAASPQRLTWKLPDTELDVSPATLGYTPALPVDPAADPLDARPGRPYEVGVPAGWVYESSSTAAPIESNGALEAALDEASRRVMSANGRPYAIVNLYAGQVDATSGRLRLNLVGELASSSGTDNWVFVCAADGSECELTDDAQERGDLDEPRYGSVPTQTVEAVREIALAHREARRRIPNIEDRVPFVAWDPWRPGIVSLAYVDEGAAMPPGSLVARDGGGGYLVVYVDLVSRQVLEIATVGW